jgi:hypothetical protein
LKISFFQQDDTQTTHSLKEGTIEIIYFLGQNLGWTKSFIYGNSIQGTPKLGGHGQNNKKTTKNNNNKDQTNISTHKREGVYIYLHTLRPISDLMLETKLERSKGFN